MSHTDSTATLAKAIYALLSDNADSLKLNDVAYGNHLNLPRSPTAVVVPGPKRRELQGVSAPGGRTRNYMTVYVDVHSSKVGSETEQRMALDELGTQIEALIHQDTTVGGIIIHGFVETWDPGETFIQGGQFRSVRMTFVGQTVTYLSA